MKFWEKFWKLVSVKDLIFITVIFIGVIIFSFFEAENKVTVDFGDDAVDIKAPRYSMNIPYDMIASTELMALPDSGEKLDGRDDMVTRTGHWKNDVWGEYYVCADLAAPNCIAAHLEDGRIFVFSRKSETTTAELFETLQTYLVQ